MRSERAITKFIEGYSCAQAVLFCFCDEVGMSEDDALKLACGFGAGMARKQEVCGAVTGGIIVIGARHGRGKNDGPEARDLTYAKTKELMERFAERHGTYVCHDLLKGCDLATPEGQKAFGDKDLLEKVCKPCVRSVVEILEDIV